MIRQRIILIILFTAIIFTAPLAAEMYKWVDERGQVHYSQTPPPGVDSEVIRPHSASPNAGKADQQLQQRMHDFDSRYKAQQEAKQKQAADKQEQSLRRENCAAAKANFEQLQRRGRVKVRQGDTYRRLSEEEHQVMFEDTKQQIKEYCH